MSEEALEFEQAMQKLEEIVRRLEEGESSLDEALALFEQGVGLVRYCTKRLESAEKKVAIIYGTLREDGQVEQFQIDETSFQEEEGA